MAAQMRNFLDQTGGLWQEDALVDKVGSVFTSTATQHGAQETNITGFHSILFHLGFIVVGVPYSEERLSKMDQITGGSPYGAVTLAKLDRSRQLSENELELACHQSEQVALTAKKINGEGLNLNS